MEVDRGRVNDFVERGIGVGKELVLRFVQSALAFCGGTLRQAGVGGRSRVRWARFSVRSSW